VEPLLTDAYYHIYNHANGNEQLFVEEENYRFFLKRYQKHIAPVADTLAYCLMPNHFHLLVQIKPQEEIIILIEKPAVSRKYGKIATSAEKDVFMSNLVSKQFANLFSSYTQAFNRKYQRRGSLFVKNFKRKRIEDEDYYTHLIQYIHLNPVKDGFVQYPGEWKFSSYQAILSTAPTTVKREKVIEWFGGIENFRYCHLESKNQLSQSSKLWES
jgi:REP-associated tyrosine transposase